MKKIVVVFLLVILNCATNTEVSENAENTYTPTPKPQEPPIPLYGKMNWNDARGKCQSLNKRLPTKKELVEAAMYDKRFKEFPCMWTDDSGKGDYKGLKYSQAYIVCPKTYSNQMTDTTDLNDVVCIVK